MLFGIFWFGAALILNLALLPALQRSTGEVRASFMATLTDVMGPMLPVAGIATIVLGIIRGIAGGVLGRLGEPYGLTWIAALVVALGLVYTGAGQLGPTLRKILTTPIGPAQDALYGRLVSLGRVDLALFGVILTLMVAMRFGY